MPVTTRGQSNLTSNQQRDNQPTNDQRRHDTAYLNKRLFYYRKVRRLITKDRTARGITQLKLTTDGHKASRGLSATAELLVYITTKYPLALRIYRGG